MQYVDLPAPSLGNDAGDTTRDDRALLLRVMQAEQHEDRLRLQFATQTVDDTAALPPECSLEIRLTGVDRAWIVSGLRPADISETVNLFNYSADISCPIPRRADEAAVLSGTLNLRLPPINR
ncbi:MAG: hypothetical protein ACKVHE_24015 [Planctomycetales bacterium]|jgi:hypothetical protein